MKEREIGPCFAPEDAELIKTTLGCSSCVCVCGHAHVRPSLWTNHAIACCDFDAWRVLACRTIRWWRPTRPPSAWISRWRPCTLTIERSNCRYGTQVGNQTPARLQDDWFYVAFLCVDVCFLHMNARSWTRTIPYSGESRVLLKGCLTLDPLTMCVWSVEAIIEELRESFSYTMLQIYNPSTT